MLFTLTTARHNSIHGKRYLNKTTSSMCSSDEPLVPDSYGVNDLHGAKPTSSDSDGSWLIRGKEGGAATLNCMRLRKEVSVLLVGGL